VILAGPQERCEALHEHLRQQLRAGKLSPRKEEQAQLILLLVDLDEVLGGDSFADGGEPRRTP